MNGQRMQLIPYADKCMAKLWNPTELQYLRLVSEYETREEAQIDSITIVNPSAYE